MVVQATHVHLDERVALKFLLPEALANAEAVRRFEREARAAVKIKSEHVARVIDVGTLETGSPYMVMEYLSGIDLAQYIERGGTLAVSEAVDYVVQAMEAIAEAHSLGIVHRDLKPANLFRIVRSDGTPSIKVLDFGISKVGGDHSMTQTSSMMGSPYYMSPEQMMSSKSVDARTDIWSLGIILYELLAGKVPFDGEAIPEIVAKVLQNPVPPIDTRVDIPSGFQRVLEKALAKERADRFADVAGFAAALAPFASPEARASVQRVSRILGVAAEVTLPDGAAQGAGADAARVAPASVTTFGGAATTNLDMPAGVPPRGRGPLYAGLALALTGLVAAGIFAFGARSSPVQPQEELVATPAAPLADATSKPSPESPRSDPKESEGSSENPIAVPPSAPASANPSTPASNADGSPDSSAPDTKASSSQTSSSRPRPTNAVSRPPPATTPAPAKPPVAPSPAAPPRTPSKPPSDLFSDRK